MTDLAALKFVAKATITKYVYQLQSRLNGRATNSHCQSNLNPIRFHCIRKRILAKLVVSGGQ